MTAEPARVAVFIDWQNTYKTAREAFGWEMYPSEYGNYSPYNLARILAAGNDRGITGGKLVRLEIHRGLPSQKHDHIGYAANRRQAAAWMRENQELVIPRLRPLRYDRNTGAPTEKGVDVQLAVAAVEWTLTHQCDVAVIFSHDSDLLPAVELITRIRGADHVETASWISDTFRSRLRPQIRVAHHGISQAVFQRVADPTNYAHASQAAK